ncbi:uncharacterized protein LOC133914895 [Phragmites australis]|uniref:uncharacterized protein LOC133914895 n=1 Tax=Phragmites australis TaxID=29695 RepID=UPI002D78C6DE|nr:uncharacterized protein LOC133914895 [Phragmites australis]
MNAPFHVATPPPTQTAATPGPGASAASRATEEKAGKPNRTVREAKQMALGFRRPFTALTVPKASFLLRRTRHKKLSYSRVRSASLLGRFHPVVSGLHDSGNALIGWTEEPAQATPAWIGDGVGRLGRLLAGLTDLLHHPQAQDPLQRRGKAAPWTERLLDDLLLLADAHGCFREALLELKQLLAEAHAALRRRDVTRLAAALRARRRSDRNLSRLASTLRYLSHRSSSIAATSDSGEAALAEAVAAATRAAATASAAIFARLASASSASREMAFPMAVSPAKVTAVPVWWVSDLLRWRRRTVAVAASESGPGAKDVPLKECCDEEEEERQAVMERLRRLEESVVAAENGCEQVYRALVNARVSLLNVLTPCF